MPVHEPYEKWNILDVEDAQVLTKQFLMASFEDVMALAGGIMALASAHHFTEYVLMAESHAVNFSVFYRQGDMPDGTLNTFLSEINKLVRDPQLRPYVFATIQEKAELVAADARRRVEVLQIKDDLMNWSPVQTPIGQVVARTFPADSITEASELAMRIAPLVRHHDTLLAVDPEKVQLYFYPTEYGTNIPLPNTVTMLIDDLVATPIAAEAHAEP